MSAAKSPQTAPQIIMAGHPVSDWDSAVSCATVAADHGHVELTLALARLADRFAWWP